MRRAEMIRINGALQPRTTFVAPVEFGLRTGETVILRPEDGAGTGRLLALVETTGVSSSVPGTRLMSGTLQILAALGNDDRLSPITSFETFFAETERIPEFVGRAYYGTAEQAIDPVTKQTLQPAALTVGKLLTNDAVDVILNAAGFNRHTALLAQSGAGKSYALGIIIEELLKHTAVRLVVVDPNGDFAQVGELPEGRDVQVVAARDPKRYAAAAQRMLHRRVRGTVFNFNVLEPVLWDGIMAGIVTTLWEHREARRPTIIILDEAHHFAPAGNEDGVVARGLMRIAAEGRKYGLWLMLASQRPQKLEGNVITQCDNLIVMRVTSQLDLEHIASSFGAVDRSILQLAAGFRSGSALIVGRIVKSPTLMKFRQRRLPESGGDISLDWAATK